MTTQTYQEIEIPSSFPKAKQVEEDIIAAARKYGYSEEDVFALQLSLEEALSNAIRHGNQEDPSKSISLRYYISAAQIDIYVADEGTGFDPTGIPDPTSSENLECPNGRGILLMRAYMNLVEYNECGNVVHMIKLNRQAGKRA